MTVRVNIFGFFIFLACDCIDLISVYQGSFCIHSVFVCATDRFNVQPYQQVLDL